MWQFESEFAEIIQRTYNVKSFRFPIRIESAPYQSGQFFFLTIRINGQEAVHHFTISSSPTDQGYIEFTKRITQHDFSQALDKMPLEAGHVFKAPKGTLLYPRKGTGSLF